MLLGYISISVVERIQYCYTTLLWIGKCQETLSSVRRSEWCVISNNKFLHFFFFCWYFSTFPLLPVHITTHISSHSPYVTEKEATSHPSHHTNGMTDRQIKMFSCHENIQFYTCVSMTNPNPKERNVFFSYNLLSNIKWSNIHWRKRKIM